MIVPWIATEYVDEGLVQIADQLRRLFAGSDYHVWESTPRNYIIQIFGSIDFDDAVSRLLLTTSDRKYIELVITRRAFFIRSVPKICVTRDDKTLTIIRWPELRRII